MEISNLSRIDNQQLFGLMNDIFDSMNNCNYNENASYNIIGKAFMAGYNAQVGCNMHLDNEIPQLPSANTPLMEGTTMAKQRKERIEIGRDADGKAQYAFASGTTPQALHESIARIMIENGLIGFSYAPAQAKVNIVNSDKPKPLFKAYAREWFNKYKAKTFRPSTLAARNSLMKNHILNAFGKKAIDEVETDAIADLYCKKVKDGLSKKTIELIRTFLREIFDSAIMDGHISKNPARDKRVKIPTEKAKEREALTKDQVHDIIDHLHLLDKQERLFVALAIYTGARKGEILALKWEDIHDDYIHISRNATYPSNTPELGLPKTKAGVRIVPILPGLDKILLESRGIGWLFGNRWDEPIHDEVFRKMWRQIKRSVNLYNATPHVFRHTFVTLAALRGVSQPTIQKIVGHSSSQTTSGYTHIQEDHYQLAKEQLSEIFSTSSDSVCDNADLLKTMFN